MNIFNVVIVDEKGRPDIYPCNSMDVAVETFKMVYENIKAGKIEVDGVIPECNIDNRVRSRKFSIRWNNIAKNENGENVYPDDFKEYEIIGYVETNHLWTELDLKAHNR